MICGSKPRTSRPAKPRAPGADDEDPAVDESRDQRALESADCLLPVHSLGSFAVSSLAPRASRRSSAYSFRAAPPGSWPSAAPLSELLNADVAPPAAGPGRPAILPEHRVVDLERDVPSAAEQRQHRIGLIVGSLKPREVDFRDQEIIDPDSGTRLGADAADAEVVPAVLLPKTSSMLVGADRRVMPILCAIAVGGHPAGGERCGMVINRAAATGLPRCDERVRAAAPAPEGRAQQAALGGAPGYRAPLAPRCDRAPTPPAVPAPAPGPTAERALDPRPGAAAGPRESRVGVSPGARRAAAARGEGRCFHRLGDPARGRDRPGARAQFHHLGRFLAFPGRGPAGLRLLRSGHLVRAAAARARGDRARQPTSQDHGCHRPPHSVLG